MSKTKKILIAVSFLLLVFSLFEMARTFLQDYAERQKIVELSKVWGEKSGKDEGRHSPPL